MIVFVTLLDHYAKPYGGKVHFVVALVFAATFLYFAEFAFGMEGIGKTQRRPYCTVR